MSKVIEWIQSNKISVAFMGGAIVIGTAYGTCTVEPKIGGDDAVQQVQSEAEEVGSPGSTSQEDN
jgi:hypothetical protein